MAETKKVKSTGRFGSRYGVGIRKRLLKVEKAEKKFYPCPSCGYSRAKRQAAGLYRCKKCGATFAGGAYFPVTLPGSIVGKMVSQRSFLPHAGELLAASEEGEKEKAAQGKAGKGPEPVEKEKPEKKQEKEKPVKKGKQGKKKGKGKK